MIETCHECGASNPQFNDQLGLLLCGDCMIGYFPKEITLEEDCAKLFRSCVEIVAKKNSDYGGGEKFGGFALSSEISGVEIESSLMVRLGDKISRIKSLLKSGNQQVKEESIEDTIKDAINYLAILHSFRMGCLDSKKHRK